MGYHLYKLFGAIAVPVGQAQLQVKSLELRSLLLIRYLDKRASKRSGLFTI